MNILSTNKTDHLNDIKLFHNQKQNAIKQQNNEENNEISRKSTRNN